MRMQSVRFDLLLCSSSPSVQIKMKFLLDFVTCCGSCSSEVRQPPAEETRMLVVPEPPRRLVRKRGRGKGGHEWRPRLSSISEDKVVITAERTTSTDTPAAGWRGSVKRKVSSMSERDRNRPLDRDQAREVPLSAMLPAFPPTPFMF